MLLGVNYSTGAVFNATPVGFDVTFLTIGIVTVSLNCSVIDIGLLTIYIPSYKSG